MNKLTYLLSFTILFIIGTLGKSYSQTLITEEIALDKIFVDFDSRVLYNKTSSNFSHLYQLDNSETELQLSSTLYLLGNETYTEYSNDFYFTSTNSTINKIESGGTIILDALNGQGYTGVSSKIHVLDGNLYFGVDDGGTVKLAEYNGSTIVLYDFPSITSLSNMELDDADGKLFIGHSNGIDKFDGNAVVNVSSTILGTLSNNTNLFESTGDFIVFIDNNSNLRTIDDTNGEISIYPNFSNAVFENNGNMVIDNGIAFIRKTNVIHAIGENSSSISNTLNGLGTLHKFGSSLYYTSSDGISEFTFNSNTFSSSLIIPFPNTINSVDFFDGNIVYTDQNGEVYSGTTSQPITCFALGEGGGNCISIIYNDKMYLTALNLITGGNDLYRYPQTIGDGLCPDPLPCIILDGKVNLTTPMPATGDYSLLTQNPNGDISSISATQLNIDDADADPANEIQTISISGSDISLSNNGGTVTIPSTGDNLGNHTATQNFDAANFNITNVVSPINANDAVNKAYVDAISVDDADADPLNEIQTISIINDSIFLSDGGGYLILPEGADNLGNHIAITDLNLSNNKITNLSTPVSPNDGVNKAYVDAISIDDADADPNNEFQTLSILGSNLTISGTNGNTITLPSPNATIIDDNDADTYITVEDTPDSDTIVYALGGTKHFVMKSINGNPILQIMNSNNTVYGEGSGQLLNTGTGNVLIGEFAGKSISDGTDNIAIGQNTLLETSNQENNIAIGTDALKNNAFGFTSTNVAKNNIAIGYQSALNNTEGYSNIAIGSFALRDNTDGNRNVAVGLSALQSNSNWHNVAYGRIAGFASTGNSNTFIGDQAGFNHVTGNKNTFLGRNAGYQSGMGSNNVAVGMDSGVSSSTDNFSNSVALGYLSRYTSSNQVVLGNSTTSEICGFVNYTTCSDSRIKENVKENVAGLNFINQLRPVSYNVNYHKVAEIIGEESIDKDTNRELELLREQKSQKVDYGFIAQEVDQTVRSLGIEFQGVSIPQKENALYKISYASFVVPLVKAIQELDDENKELKKRLNNIEERLLKLEK